MHVAFMFSKTWYERLWAPFSSSASNDSAAPMSLTLSLSLFLCPPFLVDPSTFSHVPVPPQTNPFWKKQIPNVRFLLFSSRGGQIFESEDWKFSIWARWSNSKNFSLFSVFLLEFLETDRDLIGIRCRGWSRASWSSFLSLSLSFFFIWFWEPACKTSSVGNRNLFRIRTCSYISHSKAQNVWVKGQGHRCHHTGKSKIHKPSFFYNVHNFQPLVSSHLISSHKED